MLVFGCIFVAGYYLTYASYPDARLIRSYFVVLALLGGIPVLLQLYRLGLIFLAGASAGWIVDCVVTATRDPLEPTMMAGMYNLFIVVAAALVAIVVEAAYQVRRRRRA